ncbi:hypothetical protein GCM10028799_80690 [Kribbella italica]
MATTTHGDPDPTLDRGGDRCCGLDRVAWPYDDSRPCRDGLVPDLHCFGVGGMSLREYPLRTKTLLNEVDQ